MEGWKRVRLSRVLVWGRFVLGRRGHGGDLPVQTTPKVDQRGQAKCFRCCEQDFAFRALRLCGPLLDVVELCLLQLCVHERVGVVRVERQRGNGRDDEQQLR